jgi:phenylacetate-CoA ligase
VSEYGSCDCGFLAGQWPDGTLRVSEDGVLLETLPRDDGRFDIVATVFGNPSFPLIRYVTDDVTDVPLRRPARGFAVLGSIAGRANDVVLSRSGRMVHPALLDEIVEHRCARHFRLHQHADGSASVMVQSAHSAASMDTDLLKQEIEEVLEGYPVGIEVVDSIPPSRSGKHRWITSDLVSIHPSAAARGGGLG